MEEKDLPIIELLLETEGHVPFDPTKHNKFHFTVCRLVKDEIRAHKWVECEKGRDLSWEDAVKNGLTIIMIHLLIRSYLKVVLEVL